MADVGQLLEDLTAPQREAAAHVDGPLLIVAGAGSGKTRVITRRVAYLVAQGIPAYSILSITFTNKAAGEMKQRIGALLDHPLRDFGRLDQPWPIICTFHSLCMRILRHYAGRIGLPHNFSIYDAADQTKLIKDALKTLEMPSTNFPPSMVHGAISNAKNQLVSAEGYAQNARDFHSKAIARVYQKYQKLLAANNALDFDDLLLRTAQAFRDFPDVLHALQERFQYLLIDEYQDTNHAQYVIAHAMALRHRNICVVGDPDQSIYAWRGADIKNILEFERDYPDAKVVRLEQNYRSTQRILRIASALIAHNTQRKKKGLWTQNDAGEQATLLLAQDEHDEARQITHQLRQLHDNCNHSWNQMAVFYRMNSLSRVMEDALRHANVPYQIARGVEFYNRKEIKDVLAYLRVIANPSDEVSLARIANVPARGLGDAALRHLSAWALAQGTNLLGAMEQAHQVPAVSAKAFKGANHFVHLVRSWQAMDPASSAPADVAQPPPAVVDVAQPHPADFDELRRADVAQPPPAVVDVAQPPPADFDELRRADVAQPPPAVILPGGGGRVQRIMEDVVRRSGMEAALRKEGGDELAELANVNELINAAAEYDRENPEGSLQDYLAIVSLVSDADHMKGAGGAVTMMTLHAAKGLEFPVVAIIGLEEGILPHSRAQDSLKEMEEERRLLFVGITRAQQRLIVSKAKTRTIRGLRGPTIMSPFLADMPGEEFKTIDRTGISGLEDDDAPRHRSGSGSRGLARQFRRGQVVRHPTFGIGRVAEVSDMGSQTRAIVEFNTAGRKTLILEYARLEAVG